MCLLGTETDSGDVFAAWGFDIGRRRRNGSDADRISMNNGITTVVVLML